MPVVLRAARHSGEPARGPPLGEPRHGPPPVAAGAKLCRAGQLPSQSHPSTRAVVMYPVGRAASYGVNPSTPPRSSWKGGELPMYRAAEALVHILPADARSSSFEGERKIHLWPWQQRAVYSPRPGQSPRLPYVDVVRCESGVGDQLPLQVDPAWRGSILGMP